MKKLIQPTLVIGIFLLSITFVDAQVSTGNNFGVSTDYVGWNAGQLFPLNIRHDAPAQPIQFWTNTFRRMMITDGGPFFGGNIGIGNNLPVAFQPQSRIHLQSIFIFLPLK